MANQDMGLVFKGGTCLRRCYIRGYRYFEDLDFTLRQGATPVTAADAASAWCQFVGEEGGICAEATADEVMGVRRAWVSFTGPLAAPREKAIKVDLADDEEIVEAIVLRPQKARARGLNPGDLGARLDAREATLQRKWVDRLRDQVVKVPAFDATWRHVRRALRQAGYHGSIRGSWSP